MSFNQNWPRWTIASIAKNFADVFDFENIPYFIEGQHRDTSKLSEFVEIRFDGPRFNNVSKGCWHARVEVNILITFTMNDRDYHRPYQMQGITASAFKDPLTVTKKGSGPDDDQSFVGCLHLLQNASSRDFLEINQFGQIDKQTKIIQSTVEGHYRMILETL